MRLLTLDKKVMPRAEVLRVFEVFHHTRVQDQISKSSYLSVIS